MKRLTLTVLGGFQARVGSRPPLVLPRKTQALLTFLALRPGREHTRDKLTSLLWADADEGHARHSLRQALFGLRRALGAARDVLLEGDTLALDASGVDVDAAAFERLVARATPAAAKEAAALYAGDLLDGITVGEEAFEEWLRAERARLRETAIATLSSLLADRTEAASPEDAMQTAIRLLALDPLQEGAHRSLMQLYEQQGRRASALRQYQVCVELLRRELGVEPQPATRELYQSILRESPPSRAAEASRSTRPLSRGRPLRPRAPARGPAAATADTPLVGRTAELERLDEALGLASKGLGQTLVLTGDAGIGKTRLVEHLAGEAARRGHRVIVARCHETEQILPFRPWVDALREGQIVGDAVALDVLEPVWRIELSRLLPELGAPGVFPAGTREDYLRIFEAVTRLLGHVAAAQPLVVILEDLHWADEMSVRLFSFFGRRVQAVPVLVIGTARAEEVPDMAVLRTALEELEREQPRARIALGPLSGADTGALMLAMTPAGRREQSMDRIAERMWTVSEGNPFVIVETMRALQERPALGDEASIVLPPRVRDVISARLARLGDPARQVCAAAAVVGGELGFPLLAAAAGLSPLDTAKAVEELVRRRVLTAVGEQFRFSHDRVRDVAYDSLLPPARQALHATVARAIERLDADRLDEVYDRLAHHYLRADEPPHAIEYLVHFAAQARRSYAFDDAVRSLDQALAQAQRLPAQERDRRLVDVSVRLGWVLSLLGRFRQILELLLPLRSRVEALRDPALAGPYFFRLGLTHSYLNDHEHAVAATERAIEEARRAGDEAVIGQALYVLSLTSYFRARPLDGVQQARQAVQALEAAGGREWLGLAYWMLGLHSLQLGQFDDALDAERRVAEIADSIADARLQSFAAFSTGWIHATLGRWDRATEAGRRAVDVARDPVAELGAQSYLGYSYVGKGDVETGRPLLERALDGYWRLGLRLPAARVIGFLGEAHARIGDLERARELATESLALNREVMHPWGIGYAQRLLGQIARMEGRRDDAESYLMDALATFTAIPCPYEAGRTRLELAELARARGDEAASACHAADAHRVFAELGVAIPG
jgi:DNA-binding SARP family transcriptional activator/KaiC/GvpD/RAD55 family RecA-like ATPase